jgi:hypothetical protein
MMREVGFGVKQGGAGILWLAGKGLEVGRGCGILKTRRKG